jgi:hypothetical protein
MTFECQKKASFKPNYGAQSTAFHNRLPIRLCYVFDRCNIPETFPFLIMHKKLAYRIFLNLIRTRIQSALVFADFLNKKKKLVRGSNPHLSFNCPLRAAPSEVARWVWAAWKAIPESIIVRSFKKFCISKALDGSEDDILTEDDGEDNDDSDWAMDNDSVTSDDGESDE